MNVTYCVLRHLKKCVHAISVNKLDRTLHRPALYALSARLHSHISVHSEYVKQQANSFKDAVVELGELQTNLSEINTSIDQMGQRDVIKMMKMRKSLAQLNMTPEDLNSLNVVHITGTKGKGSTAALTESILRHHGYKTGFYSSPHLVNVTERIRLNGSPIPKDLFAKYFWQVHQELSSQLDEGERLPFYFRFLTLVAFRAFIREEVDVAILEVGIGGRYDCTNVIPSPICTAVTSLALDHTNLLGNTIEKIAWQKAGIFKPDTPAVTNGQQDASASEVLSKCAAEVGCPLYIAPPINTKLGVEGEIQQVNASIAVQLCRIFMDRMADRKKWTATPVGDFPSSLPSVLVDEVYSRGLSSCKWPGRYHKVSRDRVSYYFDGAHTADSIELAYQWFRTKAREEGKLLEAQGGQIKRVLLFNKTGQRSPSELLLPVAADSQDFPFDVAVFCSNIISSADPNHVVDRRISVSEQMASVERHRQAWLDLHSQSNPVTYAFPTLSSALSWVNREPVLVTDRALDYERISPDIHLQVFVTGSLYLVGNSFAVLGEEIF